MKSKKYAVTLNLSLKQAKEITTTNVKKRTSGKVSFIPVYNPPYGKITYVTCVRGKIYDRIG